MRTIMITVGSLLVVALIVAAVALAVRGRAPTETAGQLAPPAPPAPPDPGRFDPLGSPGLFAQGGVAAALVGAEPTSLLAPTPGRRSLREI